MLWQVGKILITTGGLLIFAGLLFSLGDRIPLHLGRLPGDIIIRKGNLTLYFPLTTFLVISLVISLFLLLLKIFQK